MTKRRALSPSEESAASRLRAIWDEKKRALGLTQERVAFDFGWKQQSAVSQYLNGVIPLNIDAALKFASALRVDVSEFAPELAIQIRKASSSHIASPSIVRVGSQLDDSPLTYVSKVTGAHLSAGSGEVIWDVDEIEHSHGFREDYMRDRGLRPERCKVWSVRGDSMEPRYRSGDVVLIDMSDRVPQHGKIFALVGEDGLRIKQLRRDGDGRWTMHSFNPDQTRYPPEPIVQDNVAIIGRVRWRGGDED